MRAQLLAQDFGTIALAQARLGMFDEAEATIREAEAAIQAFRDKGLSRGYFDQFLFQQASALAEIAERRAKAGDLNGAVGSAREVVTAAGMTGNAAYSAYPLSRACVVLAQNGDTSEALRETAKLPASQRLYPLQAIEARQRKAGDEAGAMATLRMELDAAEAGMRAIREAKPDQNPPDVRFSPIVHQTAEVALIQSRLGDQAAALRTVETLPQGEPRDEALARLSYARAGAGDLAGALELIAKIETPRVARKARIGLAFLPAP